MVTLERRLVWEGQAQEALSAQFDYHLAPSIMRARYRPC